jgi:kynurenine formamidase
MTYLASTIATTASADQAGIAGSTAAARDRAAHIDVTARVADDPGTAVTVADIERYELVRACRRRPFPPRCRRHGVRRSPGVTAEVAGRLIDHSDVRCLGAGSLSIDTGSGFPVHHRWLEPGRCAVEGLAVLSSLPAAGAVAVIGVVPRENGTGDPCR